MSRGRPAPGHPLASSHSEMAHSGGRRLGALTLESSPWASTAAEAGSAWPAPPSRATGEIPACAARSSASSAPGPPSGRSPWRSASSRTATEVRPPSDSWACCAWCRRPSSPRCCRRSPTAAAANVCSSSCPSCAGPRPPPPRWSSRSRDHPRSSTRSRCCRRSPPPSIARRTPRSCRRCAAPATSSRAPTWCAGCSTRRPRSSARWSRRSCCSSPGSTSCSGSPRARRSWRPPCSCGCDTTPLRDLRRRAGPTWRARRSRVFERSCRIAT